MIFKDKKQIIFDLDGTLIDSLGMWSEADEYLLRDLKITPRKTLTSERVSFLHSESSDGLYEKYNQYLIDTYNIIGYTAKDLAVLRFNIIKELQKHIDLKPGAEEFLRKAKSLGYILTLATLSERNMLNLYIEKNESIKRKTDGFEIFNGSVLTNESVSRKKPNPDIYLKAILENRMSKEESVALEDSLTGVTSSKTAGIYTVCMYDKYSDGDREKINELADFSAKNYYELIKHL